MRITELDLETQDIEWYGIDINGNIAQFTSGGSNMVPNFICESKEKLNIVCEFFETFTPDSLKLVHFFKNMLNYPNQRYLEECRSMAQKGIYCFDFVESSQECGYIPVCKPFQGVSLADFPQAIQKILLHWQIPNADFNKDTLIYVEKAY